MRKRRTKAEIQADLDARFVACALCNKPTRLTEKPGMPVYHSECAKAAGIEHGPIYEKPEFKKTNSLRSRSN